MNLQVGSDKLLNQFYLRHNSCVTFESLLGNCRNALCPFLQDMFLAFNVIRYKGVVYLFLQDTKISYDHESLICFNESLQFDINQKFVKINAYIIVPLPHNDICRHRADKQTSIMHSH